MFASAALRARGLAPSAPRPRSRSLRPCSPTSCRGSSWILLSEHTFWAVSSTAFYSKGYYAAEEFAADAEASKGDASLSKRMFSSPFGSDKGRLPRTHHGRRPMVFVDFFSLLAGFPGRASALRLLLLYSVDRPQRQRRWRQKRARTPPPCRRRCRPHCRLVAE